MALTETKQYFHLSSEKNTKWGKTTRGGSGKIYVQTNKASVFLLINLVTKFQLNLLKKILIEGNL